MRMLLDASREAPTARWSAWFAADLKAVTRPKYHRGVVVLHLHTTTVCLVDERGYTVDKRSGGGFVLAPGATVAFPCHVVHIEEEITGGDGVSGAGDGGNAAGGGAIRRVGD